MSYIEFKDIRKSYGDNEVLKGINLNIEKGELITLLGPSGCGKSTLLRSLAGLEEVTSGSIFVDGVDITNLDTNKRQIGMVFQRYSLFPNMTVKENIRFGLKIQKMDKKKIEEKVKEIISIVGLEGKENQYPRQLSGGQQQRVALARAIVTEPKVLLLDEPLSAIDALLRKTLQTEIRRIVKELGITTIFVTHDQNEAMIMSDSIYLLHNGNIEQSGNPTEMYTSPKTLFTAKFMGNYNVIESKNFNELTGSDFKSTHIAIRPEVIEISKDPIEKKGDYFAFKAIVEDGLPHGNILRYTLKADSNVVLHNDVLFRSFKLFNPGEELFVVIDKKNCLEIS